MKNRKVCIIYTGGTIGMVPTENGFAPKQGVFAEELKNIRDMSSPEMPCWDLIEFDPLLDSSNISYEQWNQMADAIAANYADYDGFVVLHGTDTMAYSASALSFMLEGLGKPVIFTGSQIPLCELRSDGRDNLITSVMIAAQGYIREVALYFGNTLLRGNRATKSSSDGLIAFSSPNFPPLATAGIDISYRDLFAERSIGSISRRNFRATHMKHFDIAVLKLFPGIRFDMFAPVAEAGIDGLILETFGAGNIPGSDLSLPPVLEKAISGGTTVVVCSQCPQGSVHLGAYETGAALARAGAVSGYNITTEAAVTKLLWLLSQGKSQAEIKILMELPVCGELDN